MTLPSRLLLFGFALLTACAPTTAPSPAPAPAPEAPAPPAERAPEATPEAPAPGEAPDGWHLVDADEDGIPGTSVERAYRELLADREPQRTIVVAVIDGGVDTTHVGLRAHLWTNPDEVPGTGRDDDGNGFVDDRFGWNFLGNPEGESVDHDTWEVTRLYVGCTGEGSALAVIPVRAACEDVIEHFHERRAEAEELLGVVTGISEVLAVALPILRRGVGRDSLTVEAVRAFRPGGTQEQQARGLFLQLAEAGISPAEVDEALEELDARLRYNLNPDFDPRPIVGDNYADLAERGYGNPDVQGPDASHGTHVAGIIGAIRGNDTGVDGIASAVRIMGIRAVPNGDEHDKDVAHAIRYAVDNGAHIINMSFGKAYSPQKEAVDDAVRYADSRGVLLVNAAGNDGKDLATSPSFPSREYLDGGRAENWIQVGASGWNHPDSLAASFSNYGREQVDVFAPGVDIRSLLPGGGARPQSGTSMAAPVVSGIAALLMSHFPELTAAEVRAILLETATPYGDRMVARPGDGEMVPFGSLSVTGAIVNARAAILRARELAGVP